MKRIWGMLVLCLVSTGLFAAEPPQDKTAYMQDLYNTYQMPVQMHHAYVNIASLLTEQVKLKQHGQDLSEEQQKQLAIYKQRVQGLKIVLVGFPQCRPCNNLFDLLDMESCRLENWKDDGIDFYMINTVVEKKQYRTDESVLYWWDVSSTPVLLLLKDGLPVVRLNGYNPARSAEILQVLDEQVEKWC